MKTLSEMVDFLFRYYDIYFLLLPGCLAAYLALYFMWRKSEIPMFRRALCVSSIFILCGMEAYACRALGGIETFIGRNAYFLGLVLMLAGGCVISFAICKISDMKFKNIKRFYSENCWGIIIFIVLFLEFLFNKSENLKPWGSCWYGVDYSMGMGSRFLIGAFLNVITGGKVTTGKAYFFCEIILVLLIITIAFLVNAVIKKTKDEELWAVIFLVLCFLSSPGSVAGMWTDGNMGRLETYTLLLSLISVILFHKIRNDIMKYICITVLSVISIAIYQGYVFLYFPIVAVIIICDVLKDKGVNKRKVVYGIAVCLVNGAAFLVAQFLSYVHFDNAAQMAEAISRRTDLNVKEAAIHYEFFASITEAYNDLVKPFLSGGEYPREKTLILLLVMLPMIVMIIALYGTCLRQVRHNREKNSIFNCPYIYCILCNLAVLPQFLLNVDWGRWMIAITINLFFQMLYLCYMEFPEMKRAMVRLGIFININKALAVMCILYLTIFDKFEDRFYFSQIERIWFFK